MLQAMTASTPERGARVRVPPPLVFLGCTLLGFAMQQFVTPLEYPLARTPALVVGIVIMVAGIATVVSARVLFVRTGQSPMPWTPTPVLIASGPYRFTRNPMYVGITTLLIGLGVVRNVVWVSMFALVALAIVHFIAVVKEEAYLAATFGDSYAAYAARVRRYL